MSDSGRPRLAPAFLGLLRSPRLSSALALVGIGLSATTFLTVQLIGWAGLIAALSSIAALMVLALIARREEFDRDRIPPISLLAFLAWALVSVIWSQYQWVTIGSLAYLFGFTFLGVFIAFTRDTIQVVRAMGDVLRVVLIGSLIIEVFSGVLIDAPIPFLKVNGLLAELGPISGLAQTRNQLGLLALVGAITFATELRTKSVRPVPGIVSLVVAAACIGLTRSPIIIATAVLVGVAAAIIFGIRRVAPERRQVWQFIILGAAVALTIIAWVFRGRLVALFNAEGTLDFRLHLWQQIMTLVPINGIQGWGWAGRWHPDVAPFFSLTTSPDRPAATALNAFLDVLFQLGIVGLVLFVVMLGLAFSRSWLLAGRRRSVIYAWPALVLMTLILISLAESSILVDFGWLTFVICCVKASQELSWRQALSTPVATGESG
jgi:O-antigen ligase